MDKDENEIINDYWRYITPNEESETHKTDSKLNHILIDSLVEYKPTTDQKKPDTLDSSTENPTFTNDELYREIHKRARSRNGESIPAEKVINQDELQNIINALLGVGILIRDSKKTPNAKPLYLLSDTFDEGKTFQSMVIETIKKRGSTYTTYLANQIKTKKNIVTSRFNGSNGEGNILIGVYNPKEESNIGPIKKQYIKISALNTPHTETQIITSGEYKQNTNGFTHQKNANYSQLTTTEMTFLLQSAGVKTKDIEKYKPESGTYTISNSNELIW